VTPEGDAAIVSAYLLSGCLTTIPERQRNNM
jgi:hypothetical protein